MAAATSSLPDEGMTVICEACGEPNEAGAQFCSSCQAFLGWDQTDETTPKPQRAESSESAAATTQTLPGAPTAPRRPAGRAAAPRAVSPTPIDRLPETSARPPRPQARAASPVTPVDTGQTCPSCRRSDPAERRFCSRCGAVLPAHPSNDLAPTAVASTSDRARERAARKAYQRSLPTIYRFRRVGIVVLVLAVVAGTIVLTDRHPVRTAMDRFFTIRQDYRTVEGVQVEVDRPQRVIENSKDALVDRRDDALTLGWGAKTEAVGCGQQGAPVTITLTFPAARVQRLVIATEPRATEYVPTDLRVIMPETGECLEPRLHPGDTRYALPAPVTITTLQITIAGAAAPAGVPEPERISLTEVAVQTFPR